MVKVQIIVCISFIFAALFVNVINGKALIQKRAIDKDTETKKICHKSSPCGWAVYDHDKSIQFYMKNECECAPDLTCKNYEDDVSNNAYVYKCSSLPLPQNDHRT